MSIKLIGALLIFAGCGGWGFTIASQHLQRIRLLRNLISALDYMECELQYRCTALPELCRQAGEQSQGKIRQIFLQLADKLDAQISPNVERCMASVLDTCKDMPKLLCRTLRNLGNSLGRFDMPGQLRGLESARKECRESLDNLMRNKDARIRSYQTLGLCAGAAIAILFV